MEILSVLKFRIKATGLEAELMRGMGKRALNNAQRDSWDETGDTWGSLYRPKHFTHAGAKEYRYMPRRGERMVKGSKKWRRSYTGRKFRRFGHTDPLVYTGTSRRLSQGYRVRATARGVRVIMPAPGLNRRPKGGRINMADELRRVSPPEEQQLGEVFGDELEISLRKTSGTYTESIR